MLVLPYSFKVPYWSWCSEFYWSMLLLCILPFWNFWFSRIVVSWSGSYLSSQRFSRLPIFFGSTGRPFGATRTSEFASGWNGDKPADDLLGSFYHGRDLCVYVTIVNPYTFCEFFKKFATQIFCSRQNYADRCSSREIICGFCLWSVRRHLPSRTEVRF